MDLVAHGYMDFDANSMAYLFTNEDHNLLRKVPFKNKSVYGIGGAGDFPIMANVLGASKVLTKDISDYAFYFSHLKVATLKELDYDEFKTFWNSQGPPIFTRNEKTLVQASSLNSFNWPTYQKIRRGLEDSVREFFDELFSKGVFSSFYGDFYPLASYLHYGFESISELSFNPFFSSKREFSKFSKGLDSSRITLEKGNIYGFPHERFDIIYLSNLKLRKRLMEACLDHLTPKGKVLLYSYRPEEFSVYHGEHKLPDNCSSFFDMKDYHSKNRTKSQFSSELTFPVLRVLTRK